MKNFKVNAFPQKSLESITLGTFEQKTAFSVILSQKVWETGKFFLHCFCVFRLAGGLICLLNSLHHQPLPGHSLCQQPAHQAISELPLRSLPLSK
jgi:hypothetical protein